MDARPTFFAHPARGRLSFQANFVRKTTFRASRNDPGTDYVTAKLVGTVVIANKKMLPVAPTYQFKEQGALGRKLMMTQNETKLLREGGEPM